MQTIIIRQDILKIHFIHEQDMGNKHIQIPSVELEKIINDYIRRQENKVAFSMNDGKSIMSVSIPDAKD